MLCKCRKKLYVTVTVYSNKQNSPLYTSQKQLYSTTYALKGKTFSVIGEQQHIPYVSQKKGIHIITNDGKADANDNKKERQVYVMLNLDLKHYKTKSDDCKSLKPSDLDFSLLLYMVSYL